MAISPYRQRILDVFDEVGGALLILGAPGTGKTTLLLELARDLLDRAEHDPTHPIPVVFPLSSWAERRLPLVTRPMHELYIFWQGSRSMYLEQVDGVPL